MPFALAGLIGVFGAPARRLLGPSFAGRRQIDTGAACFGEADGDGLPRRARAMLALADLVDLVLHEFAGLRARRLAFTFVLPGFANDLLSWHESGSVWGLTRGSDRTRETMD